MSNLLMLTLDDMLNIDMSNSEFVYEYARIIKNTESIKQTEAFQGSTNYELGRASVTVIENNGDYDFYLRSNMPSVCLAIYIATVAMKVLVQENNKQEVVH